jgi:hypothetical protein
MLLTYILRQIFWPHTRGQRLKRIVGKIERQIAHARLLLTLIVDRYAFGGVKVNLAASTVPFCWAFSW